MGSKRRRGGDGGAAGGSAAGVMAGLAGVAVAFKRDASGSAAGVMAGVAGVAGAFQRESSGGGEISEGIKVELLPLIDEAGCAGAAGGGAMIGTELLFGATLTMLVLFMMIERRLLPFVLLAVAAAASTFGSQSSRVYTG